MTWRSFVIGLFAAAGICLLEPYSVAKGYGFFTNSCFPGGAVLVLVFVAVLLNGLIKLVRRGWALTRAELMLVYCMALVSCAIPNEGLGSFWYGIVAGGPYMARRSDLYWEDNGALTAAPEGLVLSKDPKSVAASQYFQGSETGRVPWRPWVRPLTRWAVFLVLMYVAVFFTCAILRRQWVEIERLMFPLARIPLEFTEGSERAGLLPPAFANRAFLAGLVASVAFRFVRALPLLFGADHGWSISMPIGDILKETPLAQMDFQNFNLWYTAIGFAYLAPADVSLSIWSLFLFSRFELQVGHWLAIPSAAGGTWSHLMRWQQLGSNLAFLVGMLFVARRHLWAVLRKATGLSHGSEDAGEPVSYRVAFWGFVLSMAGCIAWHCYYGMSLVMATGAMALVFCWYIVYARMVAQGGLYVARVTWSVPDVLHGATGRLGGAGAVITSTVGLFLGGATIMLSPVAMDAFRISSVFKRGRHRFLLALVAAILVAMLATTYMVLTQAYSMGALNFSFGWAAKVVPISVFDHAQRIITQPAQLTKFYWGPLSFGAILTAFVMFMRARFYWWPLHPIGLLACNSWHAHRLWFPFLLGWLIKITIMKFSGGQMLKSVRQFFIAFIITEVFMSGISALICTVTRGAVPLF
ncbi:MAG: hypothetical protein KAX44_08125 [Candidatus Brocadiae bacterium]|nr:hypothetical protein [Candidatus Brocadiia bacterium]